MIEQRRISRWGIGREAKLKLYGAYVFANCYLQDLSNKGAQVALKIKLPQGVFFKFHLGLSDDITLDVEAFVIWHKSITDNNIYGVYFSKISDTDKAKIFNFLRRDFPAQVDQRWWQGIKGKESVNMERAEDKRVFARFAAKLPVRFIDAYSNQEGYATASDVSAKGIGFISKTGLNKYTPVELWLDIPDNSTPLYSRGAVAWSQPLDNDEYRYGIHLEKADLMGLARVLRVKKP